MLDSMIQNPANACDDFCNSCILIWKSVATALSANGRHGRSRSS